MFKKARFRNSGLWTALVSAGLLIAQQAAHLFGYDITDDIAHGIVGLADSILGVLILLGIISNPTKPDGSGFNL
jgi:phi LC3 family holin